MCHLQSSDTYTRVRENVPDVIQIRWMRASHWFFIPGTFEVLASLRSSITPGSKRPVSSIDLPPCPSFYDSIQPQRPSQETVDKHTQIHTVTFQKGCFLFYMNSQFLISSNSVTSSWDVYNKNLKRLACCFLLLALVAPPPPICPVSPPHLPLTVCSALRPRGAREPCRISRHGYPGQAQVLEVSPLCDRSVLGCLCWGCSSLRTVLWWGFCL